ncbi:MAG: FtsK/SpoIIIE domain-containing protein [Clostridium perfringens]|nr:FtsK/SpoIIIE domain-containing protein [Clostridium perfringens]
MKQTKKIEVPNVTVDLKGIVKNGQAIVSLERLPAMNNVDELIILVSNSFRGKYKNFAVVDFVEADDTLSFNFTLEDVNVIKTFTPKSLREVKTDDCYKIRLQNDLIWQLNKAPHGIISGVTNSGKTTTIYQIILSCFLNGINDIKNDIKDGSLYLVDPKNEFTALSSFYSNIYTEIADIFEMLEMVNSNLENRQKYISEMIAKTGKLGATGYDFDIKCDIIIIDELTSLISSIPTSKKEEFNQDRFYRLISQIIQRGRSSGVYLIFAGQNFNADTLKVAIRNAPAFRLLLGAGTQEDYKFIFSNNTETIKKGLPAAFMGYYTLSGFVNNPQRFYVPNLHKYNLNTLESFTKAYKKGLK